MTLLTFCVPVPVVRPQDEAKTGAGHVFLDDDDPLLLHGVGTKFTEQIKPRARVALSSAVGSYSAEVLEVLSDTQLKVKKEFGTDSGKGTTKFREKVVDAKKSGKPGLTYKVVPHIDQAAMFGAVYNNLKNGGCIGIFPEGSCV